MPAKHPTLPHRARVPQADRKRNHSTCTVCGKRCARVQSPKGPRWAHAPSYDGPVGGTK